MYEIKPPQKYKGSNLGPIHTAPDKFENATLLLRLGLLSTLIRINCPPKTEISKTLFKVDKFKNAVLLWTENFSCVF